MKRIFLFITGFLFLYILAVIVLNSVPTSQPKQPEKTPQIQVQQPTQEATPSGEAAPTTPLAPNL